MPKRNREQIANIVTDADVMGEEAAAKKHRMSARQVRRYRKMSETRPDVSERVQSKRIELSKGWLEEAKKARMEALERGLELARKSDNLRDVTGFLKIVHDAVLADEMLNRPPDELDRCSDGLVGQAGQGREVLGVSTTH